MWGKRFAPFAFCRSVKIEGIVSAEKTAASSQSDQIRLFFQQIKEKAATSAGWAHERKLETTIRMSARKSPPEKGFIQSSI